MTNLTPPALPHPRPPTLDCAPEVSISETQSPGLAPISGAFRPNPVDSVSLASPALRSTDPYPQPRQLTPGPSIAGSRGPPRLSPPRRPPSTLRGPKPSPRRYPSCP